ncbi:MULTISPECIES: cytochrome c biogenesis CcdA family protein [Alkalibacillus]|uniref:Cytochrome C biogenesis protein CcdA n=2 Tax=Alkalibacillus TaxID=331654 RepID=A0A511W0G8_9BACI|nr:cytochrome c biogenesis protein CcdA [Alkalibacillus haloalkaliphilus]GEN44546.1 cytochrome C biogenesis protein CcdA [Alkalibacillus haloalkaliphilus]
MIDVADLTIWLALGAGMLSFLSPCTLPLFPAYLSYITGVSVKELENNKDMKVRSKLLIHSVLFLFGVSLIFIGLGVGVSFIGQWIQSFLAGESGQFIQRIAGIFIIVMGLFVGGWLNIKTFMKEKRFNFARKPAGYLGTVFVGMGFAAGWTPCIGPIFATILVAAASNPSQGAFYTIFYVIGFALPFLILTFFIGRTRWIVKYSGMIMKVGGVVMIIMGLLLFTGQMTRISIFLLELIDDTWFSNLG